MTRSRFRRQFNDFEESARIAGEQLRQHKMRSLLTALGVIIGVWAVILIGVAINGLDNGVKNSLNMLGSDHFFVERWPWRNVGDDWPKYMNRPNIDPRHADAFNDIVAENPDSGIVVAVPVVYTRRAVGYLDRKASNVDLVGTNTEFGYINTADIEHGRFFSHAEFVGRQNVAVVGRTLIEALFPDEMDQAVGKRIKIGDISYTIVGTLAEQGKFLGLQSFDRNVIIPLPNLLSQFVGSSRFVNASIRVVKKPDTDREVARDEIIGTMRRVRGLEPGDEEDFEVNASDAIEDTLGPIKTNIAIGGFAITGLSLFVGAIGIMNITFVSVKERTKEIGTRRAIGARRSSILMQFLIEAVSICLLGGVVGLLLAFASKSVLGVVAPAFPASFSVDLMLLAVSLSVATGILSGIVPAFNASRLDPATALRHE